MTNFTNYINNSAVKHYFDTNNYLSVPDENGFFGNFGGIFVPDVIANDLKKVKKAFYDLRNDEKKLQQLYSLLIDYAGRKSPLFFAERLTNYYGKGKIYLKREDLNHTGAHKINNALGQVFLAKQIGKKKIIAETGAGQHGVATATVCAFLGIECEIFMGAVDVKRQQLNVQRMKALGAKVHEVEIGQKTLKEAVDVALEYYAKNIEDVYYLIGSAVGPAPFPEMVRFFQSVIGNEAKEQIMQKEGRMPNYVVACVGGGSNAIGAFYSFIPEKDTKLIAVEAGGLGVDTGKTSASITAGEVDVIHGFKCYVLKDEQGLVKDAYSVAAGLDYPAVGPEISYLASIKRIQPVVVNDEKAVKAFALLSRLEGIIPALESSHALGYLDELLPQTTKDDIVIVNVSGRGDKDCEEILQKIL